MCLYPKPCKPTILVRYSGLFVKVTQFISKFIGRMRYPGMKKHQNELRVKRRLLRPKENISIELHTKFPRARPGWWPCHLHADTIYCVTATCRGHVICTLTQFTVLLQHFVAMSSAREAVYCVTAACHGHVICTLKQFTVLLQHVVAMSSECWYNLLCYCNMSWPCFLNADTIYCVTATCRGHVICTLTHFTVLMQHVPAMSSERWHSLLF